MAKEKQKEDGKSGKQLGGRFKSGKVLRRKEKQDEWARQTQSVSQHPTFQRN